MGKELSRRVFLKNSIAQTTFLSFSTIGFFPIEKITATEVMQCKKCDAVNKISPFPFVFGINRPIYCHNCGIDLKTLTYDIDVKGLALFPVTPNKFSSKNNKSNYIPFPNHINLVECRKPQLQLSKVQF